MNPREVRVGIPKRELKDIFLQSVIELFIYQNPEKEVESEVDWKLKAILVVESRKGS